MRVELVVDGVVRAETFVPWTGPVVQGEIGSRGHYVTVGGKMALYWEEPKADD